jgi:hypothetical protein
MTIRVIEVLDRMQQEIRGGSGGLIAITTTMKIERQWLEFHGAFELHGALSGGKRCVAEPVRSEQLVVLYPGPKEYELAKRVRVAPLVKAAGVGVDELFPRRRRVFHEKPPHVGPAGR